MNIRVKAILDIDIQIPLGVIPFLLLCRQLQPQPSLVITLRCIDIVIDWCIV